MNYDALELPADQRQTIIADVADLGSLAHDALSLLITWSATLDPPSTHPATGQRA